jgi:hypothetical protein
VRALASTSHGFLRVSLVSSKSSITSWSVAKCWVQWLVSLPYRALTASVLPESHLCEYHSNKSSHACHCHSWSGLLHHWSLLSKKRKRAFAYGKLGQCLLGSPATTDNLASFRWWYEDGYTVAKKAVYVPLILFLASMTVCFDIIGRWRLWFVLLEQNVAIKTVSVGCA